MHVFCLTLLAHLRDQKALSSGRERERERARRPESYTHAHHFLPPIPTAEEVEKWRKVSIAATGIVIVMSIKEMVDMAGGHHGAHSDKPLPDYMQIRAKPFPWECSSCSLFDTECFKRCKAERAGDSVEDHH